MTKYKLVTAVPSRDDLIQCLLATHGQSEGTTADAILSMLTAAHQEGVPEETINAVITLVKDAAAAHLNSEFNSCLSKIRKLLTAAQQGVIYDLR